MATIIVGTYMVRYPLGGNLSWALQYLVGLQELGHDVYMVEKYVHDNSCYDPEKLVFSNDCTYGVKVVSKLLSDYGFEKKWCFVESGEVYHGLSRKGIGAVFKRADLYMENGAHGAWEEESLHAKCRVYIDVDPMFTQIKFYNNNVGGKPIPKFDHYFTNGLNVGKEGNTIPTNGINWKYIFNPVNSSLFKHVAPPPNAPYSTIMNWKSYDDRVYYKGVEYGHKNIEFEKFRSLPTMVKAPLEMAVSGLKDENSEIVRKNNWSIKSAQKVTFSFNAFREYLQSCKGEFSVCKNMYTATNSGWFSDKSAAFMASGRPVIVQETGFSKYLPVGAGLFAVNNVDEAKEAIETIESNYEWHCEKAWEIANEYLSTNKVLGNFLKQVKI